MRILPGHALPASNTSMTVPSLVQMALTKPEYMFAALELGAANYTMFSSLLARKGLTASLIYGEGAAKNMRLVGNSIIEWGLRPPPVFKGKIVSFTSASETQPGLNGEMFTIVVDTDKFMPNMVLKLVDHRTLLFVQSRSQVSPGNWSYQVSLKYNRTGSFVDPTLLATGKEIEFDHTNYPEMSSDAFELRTGMEWHRNYLTIQRIKYTMSGSARATKVIVEHNGYKTWETRANLEMMQHWFSMQERALLLGKATRDAAGNHYLRDLDGREVVSGDGLLASAEGSLKFGYNRLTPKVLHNVLMQMQNMRNDSGMLEVAVMGGREFVYEFSEMMRDVFAANPQPLFQEKDGERGVNGGFSWYQPWPDTRIYVGHHPHLDNPYGARELVNGRNPNSGRAIFVSLGNLVGGDANVQLVALGNGEENRAMIMRGIPGMAGPAISKDGRMELTAHPVDGWQVHALSETGLILRDPMGVAELFRYRV
jgi:hypothetical protein